MNGKRVFSSSRGHRAGLVEWHRRGPGATWRLNGPASGAVDITDIDGRVRVWDKSAAKDLAVTVPAGTPTRTLSDGSIVYLAPRRAGGAVGHRLPHEGGRLGRGGHVHAGGRQPRPQLRPREGHVRHGPLPGRARQHGGSRVLLQPIAAK